MERAPPDIEKYLLEDEVVERSFKLEDYTVYATNYRLFVKIGRRIQDFRYTHISSVGYEVERYYRYIGYGILCLFFGWLLNHIFKIDGTLTGISGLIGVILILVGIFGRTEYIEVVVLGLPRPLRLRGSRHELDSLMKIIMERRSIQ